MSSITTRGTGALGRKRARKLGSVGAIVFVLATGAAIALGVVVTADETAAPAHQGGNTSTQPREQSPSPAAVDGADKAYLATGAHLTAREALENAVRQGQVPEQALTSSDSGFADQAGQPR